MGRVLIINYSLGLIIWFANSIRAIWDLPSRYKNVFARKPTILLKHLKIRNPTAADSKVCSR